MNNYYTYAYLREDRTPYYIGKGSGTRVYEKGKNEIRPPKDKSRIIFLKQNLNEEGAFKHEKYMIAVFGRKDLGTGILRNRTDGGDGASGAIRSFEFKRKLSESKKGKNNHMYGKSGENSPNYGKSLSEEHKKKLSETKKGSKWWNDGCGNSKLALECPGEGWILGRENISKLQKGCRWWNDGCGNTKFAKECPGNGWVLGRIKIGAKF